MRAKITIMDVAAMQAELRKLLGSWAYAFASADACSIPSNPEARRVLQRVEDLRARIAEHTRI